MLCQLYSVYRTVQRRPAEQDDKSCASTDQQGVGENAQGLDQSLFDRMCDGCGGRHVRGRTHPSLVAEQAALDSLHQGGSDRAAYRLFPSESTAYDQFDDGRQFCDIEQYDPQCECHVSQCHHGDEYAADFGYSLDSSKNNDKCQYRQYRTYDFRIETERALHGLADRVALYRVEREAESDRDQDSEQCAHPVQPQSVSHIVSRSSDKGVLPFPFVKLCERRLDKSAGRT